MARPRSFAPDEALEAAMRVFWEKGFAETSYDDLVTRTGVSRKGLYTVFGDKRALFEAALDRYRKTIAVGVMEPLDCEDLTLEDLRRYFIDFTDKMFTPQGKNGCLIANTSVDESAREPGVKDQIDRHLRDMTARFATALNRTGMDPAAVPEMAAYCTGIMQGLFVFAHARADRTLVDRFLQTAMKVFD